jgi:DGQHR domain-containing protein
VIENIMPREKLLGFARKQARDRTEKSVSVRRFEEARKEGWQQLRRSKRTVRVYKAKSKSDLLESRVWTLFYRMGFPILSGKGGAFLRIDPKDPNTPKNQLDVVAIDDEVAIAIECKSSRTLRKDPSLPSWLGRFAEMKGKFARTVRKECGSSKKRNIGLIVVTWDIVLRDTDRKRAEESRVLLLDEQDLCYYEALVKHLAPAAKYQLLAELFRGKRVPGLEIRVPALRTRMGRDVCYTFSVKPAYLLKIAYVAHRAKGKAVDVDMYQRMVKKGRLKRIAQFIADDGVFPTNIVVNIRHKKYARFDVGAREADQADARFGWLTLTPAYACAWIIDGQHRLYAYSGHKRAGKSYLNVLAFEGLSSAKQAQMFVDINSEQRKVKRALLVELDADLKWEAEDEDDRIQAIISKTAMALDTQLDSPLRGRILLADARRTETRCVSLTSVSSALNRTGFFVRSRRKGITEYGPLWRDDATQCLTRALTVLKEWFSVISTRAREWWEKGAGEGGGLAMNNGITVCVNVLRTVLDQFIANGANLSLLDDEELCQRVRPYAEATGDFLGGLGSEVRQSFRQLQGSDGQLTGTRMCQEALTKVFPRFDPPGLPEWIQRRESNNNEKGRAIIEWIETTLQQFIIDTLKSEYDLDDTQWWFDGVPKAVRKKVDERINESDGKAGTREQNFDLIHYREIIRQNWALFREMFGYTEAGASKDKQTQWIVDVSQMRNTVMHPSRREFLSFDRLSSLENYKEWLARQVSEASLSEGN